MRQHKPRKRLDPLHDHTTQAVCQIDDIRQTMLDCLDAAARWSFPRMERRILLASDVPALWFLRPDLLMALAAHSGEQATRQVIDDISEMFDSLLPKGLSSRPAALRR